MFVTRDPLGNPVDQRHPWNQHTIPRPQKRDFDDKYSWVMSPRWYDGTNYLAADTGGGPIARLWATAQGNLVDFGYVKATGNSVLINLPRTATKPEVTYEWKVPTDKTGAAVQRDRARPGPDLLPGLLRGLRGVLRGEGAGRDPGRPDQDMGAVQRARRGEQLRVHRGGPWCPVAPHGDPRREDRQLPPLPADPWNASVRDSYGTPGPYEDAVQNTPIFEENTPENFKGIDIMRAVRSFDPCLPCGVHMYLGGGNTVDKVHSPAGITLST